MTEGERFGVASSIVVGKIRPQVEIGLTDLPKIGGTPGTSGSPIMTYLGRAND